MVPTARASTEQIPARCRNSIKSHISGLLTSVPITSDSRTSFQQYLTRHAGRKKRKTKYKEKQSIRNRLKYDTDVGIVRILKITEGYGNSSNGKRVASTEEQEHFSKHRAGHYREA